MNIVLIETSGNQHYIFSTNKLRENVGASELTYQIGTSVVNEIINGNGKITPIIMTSSKALLLADDEESAKEIVRRVTTRALKTMPGLTVHGAVCEVADNTAESMHKAVGDVHHRLENIRYKMPSNIQRFQRIPFTAECVTSNFPASEVIEFQNRRGKDIFTFSRVTLAKREALAVNRKKRSNKDDFDKGRIAKELERDFGVKLPRNVEKLEEIFPNTKWLAVIHADGNGLGQIFLKFNEAADMQSAETYKKDYQEFSDEIDKCTKKAFGEALQKLQGKFESSEIPVIPLILGGDDLTFICDGEYAVNLTKDFLQNFESESRSNSVIKRLTADKGKPPLGICAGIAIIKPHYPFHQAYALAEELLQSAKKTKDISPSLSALDYHVVYDSSGTRLDEIREKMPFTARPFVVTDENTAKGYTNDPAQKDWIEKHHFDQLKKRVEVMLEKEEDGKRKLPRSQTHVLREGLFVADTTKDTQAEVDARAKLINHRYPEFEKLFMPGETLFFDALLFDKIDGESETKRTHLLDAMDVAEFWK
jgi:hypothetical protein